MIEVHPCAVPTCRKAVPREMLMCYTHWRRVPSNDQKRVWDAYRDGAGVGTPDYVAAVRAAVNSAAGGGPARR
jgi:hypothetical protein